MDLKKQELVDFMPSRLFLYYNERVIEGTVDFDAGLYNFVLSSSFHFVLVFLIVCFFFYVQRAEVEALKKNPRKKK